MRGFLELLQSMRNNFSFARNVRIMHETVVLEEYARVLQRSPRRPPGAFSGTMAAGRPAGRVVPGVVGRLGIATAHALRKIPHGVVSLATEKIIAWSHSKLAEYLREKKQEFISATENPADGVTILITFANPGLIPLICRSLRGGKEMPELSTIPRGIPSAHVRVYAGMRRD
jgi:hypothetical protein